MSSTSSFDEQQQLVEQKLEKKGKKNRKRSSESFKRRGSETKTSKRRGSETSKGTERTRSMGSHMGSFFGIFSGTNTSEHTLDTVEDPALSDEEAKQRGKKKHSKKQNKKKEEKQDKKKEEKKKQTKKIPKLRLSKFNLFEKKQKKRISDRSITDKCDGFEFGLSQQDISEWVREQRTKAGEEKHPAEAMLASTTTNIATTESYDAVYEDQRDSCDSTMLSPLHLTDEYPEKDSASEKPASSHSLQYPRESNRSLASSDSMHRTSNRSLASSDSLQRESNRSLSDAHPILLAETNQIQTIRTIHMPRQVSKRKSLNRRSKTELDITDHISLLEEAEKKPKSTKKKTKPKRSSSSSCGSTEQPINSRRKYPSKKGLRKPSSRNSAGSTSNRIDFAGGISESPPKEHVDTETVLSEMSRLRSLVDLMMTRMEKYEITLTDEQSDGLLQAGVEYNKSKMATEGAVFSNSDKQKTKKKKKKRLVDRQSSATATEEQDVDEMITKLEEEQKLYQEQLSFTKNQLKALKDNQAETNMRILADYQQRLEEKNKEESPPNDIAPQIPEKCPSLDSTSSSRSRSMFIPSKSSSLDSTKSSIDSTCSNQSKSMFIPSKSASLAKKDSMRLNRSRSKHIPKKNSSLDSKSSRSTKSMDEDASLWDSGFIDFSPEESEHTISSTSSTRSVKFNPTVTVATTLSRYDMAPKEKFAYWAGDGDDEDLPDSVMKQLMEKWTVRKKIEDVEWELISRQKGEKKILGDHTPLPSHLVSDCIKQRLPETEREGHEGYTYTIGIQD